MKKNLLLALYFIFWLTVNVFAQGKSGNWCGFDEKLQQQLKDNPALRQQFERWRENVRNSVRKIEMEKSPAGVLQIIPVVVHVIHNNGIGNISEAQVKDGVRVLNEDFVRRNEDSVNTRPVFKPFAGVADFEFRLATKDPSGNPTNGIVRINSPLTYDADDNTKSLSYWNSSKYFNIWLVNSISGSSQTSTILGYAQFPGWGPWDTYGVIMLHSQFGRFGTSSEGRTASHEVGHCLNLFHTFEGGCGGSNCSSNGDDVCDTPPTANSTQGCSFTQNLCGNDAGGASPYSTDVEDQIENYMSYDDCQNMFSSGQITRMKAAITNNPELQNLISDANLADAGVNSLMVADFNADLKVVCIGNTVKFSDFSSYGQNGWSWNFQGGVPASSFIQNPEVTYNATGLFDVSFSTTDGSATKTKTRNSYILVVSADGNFLPFSEGFENGSLPDSRWYIGNIDNDANTFQRVTGVGYSGNGCVKLDNSANPQGNRDELVVGSFDFSNMTGVAIKFKAAYAQKDTSTKDKLIVYVSSDCGRAWSPRLAKIGSALSSAPAQTSAFTPSDTSQWKEYSATLTTSMMKENILIKFVFESDEGNNFYLDDINITGIYNPVPVLKSPANNATGQPDNVKVDWKSVGGVVLYQYEIDTTFSFNSPLLGQGQHNFISNDPDGNDTEHQYSGLLHGQKYYWRARTVSGTDTSAWSAVWNFTVSANGVGIESPISNLQSPISIFPNPSGDGKFTINKTENEDFDMTIYNIRLEKIYQRTKIKSGSFFVDLGEQPKGIYFMEISYNGNNLVKKLVIY